MCVCVCVWAMWTTQGYPRYPREMIYFYVWDIPCGAPFGK